MTMHRVTLRVEGHARAAAFVQRFGAGHGMRRSAMHAETSRMAAHCFNDEDVVRAPQSGVDGIALGALVELVVSLFAADAALLPTVCAAFHRDPRLLRAALSHERVGAPSRLIRAVRAGCTTSVVAHLLAATRPEVLNGGVAGGATALQWCALLHRPDLVRLLLAMPALEVWAAGGGGAFITAAAHAADTRRPPPHRAAAAECARAIALAPLHPVPTAVLGEESLCLPVKQTVLWGATAALLPGVLTRWLADPRVTPAVVNRRSGEGWTLFSSAAARVLSADVRLTGEECTAARACARALAWCGKVDPSAMSGQGASHLAWAAFVGLPDVVSAWLEDCRVSPAVVNTGDDLGFTPLGWAVDTCMDRTGEYTREERDAARRCAQLLVESGRCDPDAKGGEDVSQSVWAARAGLALPRGEEQRWGVGGVAGEGAGAATAREGAVA